MSTHAAAFGFVERLAQDLEDQRLELPAFPEAVLRIQQALQAPDTSADDIVRILGTDPALAARILRIANSAHLRRGDREITDLRQAVSRMGFNIVRSVAVAFAVRHLRERDAWSTTARDEIAAVWRDSLNVASICYVLAKHCTRLNADQALLTGLLHALGRLYIVMRAEDVGAHDVDIREVAAGWQATIGRAIIESWQLPKALQHAIEHQDDLHYEAEVVSLTDLLIAAKRIAAGDSAEDADCGAFKRIAAARGTDTRDTLAEHADEVESLRSSLGE